ncbi:superkiller complex protein 3 [Amia ocellicauda]|uniref:superkiller complex protein 3 n=1 Tax=Amia ocellicauda TaxID=2972642 RepID=UPI0034649241
MSNKEVKSALKSAREAIKNKEFKEALKHCKGVLKLEKNNYNAWVFIGVAAAELEQPEQSQIAYKKATELEPEQLLAWQGLANLYEKSNKMDFKADLQRVFQKLLTLYESSDKSKWYEVGRKLVEIYHKEKNHLEVGRVWHRLVRLKVEEGVEVQELRQLWVRLTQLLKDSVEEQDNETQQLLIIAFENAMSLMNKIPSEDHQKLSNEYIQCLSRLPHEQMKMRESCKTMQSLYPTLMFPLEILSLHFIHTGVYSEEALQCFTRLVEMDSSSGPGHVGLGIIAFQEKKYDEAVKSLSQGLKQIRTSASGWYHLAQAQLKMHQYHNCIVSCIQALQMCGAEEQWKQRLLRIRVEALVKSGGGSCAEEALDTLSQLSDADNDPVLLVLKGTIYLQKGLLDQAYQVATDLLDSHPQLAEAHALKGHIHLAQDQHIQAEQSFQKAVDNDPSSGEYYFNLGQLYWNMGEETRRDKSKAHTHLLKAAKLDSNLGPVFRVLGCFYREVVQEQGRARGCFKKAFDLDSSDTEAGSAAVDLSMELGDMDSALTILRSVTEQASAGSAKWAWLRRGLYYLKINQHSQAIADLQAALRADPKDSICWECLGEAYLNRRSFTAALKAFSKANYLNPQSIYNLYQIAAIKQTLGKCKEATNEYMQIIQREEYVPALKGLGECYLSMAQSAMKDYLDGRAMDFIEKAIKYLFRAVQCRPDLSCLWKLLGDVCTSIHSLAPARAQASVPGLLCGHSSSPRETLPKADILRLGSRCYAQALKLMADCANLWSDLGLNYYHQAQHLTAVHSESECAELFEKSLQCVKKAVMLDSRNYFYWNVLGVVAMSKGIENLALAQHSFIKSVNMDANNVVAWTNLGVLYLKKENIELAHEAFKVAQSLEPLYVNCWIGQALIAESVGSYETMDLFRHTTELSTHIEGVNGYAYWVCSTLLDKSNRDSELYRYNIVQMNAISAAQVALCKYTERVQTDAAAFSMLGYLNEHLHLKLQATQAYQRAVELLQSTTRTDELNFALRNYGRTLCNTGQYEKAVKAYSSIPLTDLHDLTGLALAYFRSSRLQDSILAYEKALKVASSEKEKAYILTALALLQHRQNNMDSAKTLLFKCSVLKEPCTESLLCLCALGLVHRDATLAAAALNELLKHSADCEATEEERCLLTCSVLALQGNNSAVQRQAAKAVHSNPGNAGLWALLSRVVPQYNPRNARGGASAGSVACHFSMTKKKALLYSGVNQLASGWHSGEDGTRNGLKTIQRAALLCPDDPGVWAALLSACHTENTASCLRDASRGRRQLEGVLTQLVSEKVRTAGSDMRPKLSALKTWCVEQAVWGLKQAGLHTDAEAVCTKALSSDPEQPGLVLLQRQVQCEALLLSCTQLPDAVLEELRKAVLANYTSMPAWHWLAEVYRSQGLLVGAVMCYRQSLQVASQQGNFSGKLASLLRLALLALAPCMANVSNNEWKDLVKEATSEALKLAFSPLALLIQALLQFSIKMGARETRRLLEKVVYTTGFPESITSVARWYLLRHLHSKNDQELIDTLMDHARAAGDSRLEKLYNQLCP